MARKVAEPVGCALCGAKEVSEPRGDERYCRDCWDKKIAVEDIVAREFTLKRYIRAHSAEKYLVYHSTQKRPVGQLLVVDDGYDLFLTLLLYPNFVWDDEAYHLEKDPEHRTLRGDPDRRRRRGRHRAVGRRQVAPRRVSLDRAGSGRVERRDLGRAPPNTPPGCPRMGR